MSANPKVLRYADALREAALDDETAAASYEASGFSTIRDVASYRRRAAALRALADLCERAEWIQTTIRAAEERAEREGDYATHDLRPPLSLLNALAAGYREATDA